MGHGFRTNAWMAAFANGAMAHTVTTIEELTSLESVKNVREIIRLLI